jgi:hypothetical protein
MTVNQRAQGGRIPSEGRPKAGRIRMAHKSGSVRRGSSHKSKNRKRPLRRFDLMLPAAMGAEVRLPALPEFRPGARLLTLPLLAVLLWAGYQLLNGATFLVGQAEILGAEFMSDALVRSIAQVDNTPVFTVDPRQIAEELEAYPEVSSADVAVEWPNKVVIQLVERKPVVAWDDGGRMWWLCDDGVAFLEREALPGMVLVVSDEQVLQIQEDPLAQVIDPEVLRGAMTLSALLGEMGSLRFEPDSGLVLEDMRGWKAYFGADGDMDEKARVYIRIGDLLQEQARQASMVSVVDPSSPYYILAR